MATTVARTLARYQAKGVTTVDAIAGLIKEAIKVDVPTLDDCLLYAEANAPAAIEQTVAYATWKRDFWARTADFVESWNETWAEMFRAMADNITGAYALVGVEL